MSDRDQEVGAAQSRVSQVPCLDEEATVSAPGEVVADAPERSKRVTLSDGSVIAERYRVTRFIAQGGMGEVYEAEDLVLNTQVALKTIRPGIAGDEQAVARFKREIRLARQVTHPNVCRIFDLGIHGAGSSQGSTALDREVLFLTMELLSGVTLHRRISEDKRFDVGSALPIALQMAEGLDVAHGMGIIHRDFKTANVMLVPSLDSRFEERVVITDFGLARRQVSEGEVASISDTGVVVGTPAYMAPEQVQGLELTPAADIYALGIVLYEMVTGVRPFEGSTALSVATRRLTEAPSSPRLKVPDLDPVWEAVILRCLERDPQARFQRANDVAKALREGDLGSIRLESERTSQLDAGDVVAPVGAQTAPEPKKRRSRLLAVGVGLTGALLLGYSAYRQWWPAAQLSTAPDTEVVAAEVHIRPSLAVLSLTNVSGDEDSAWLSTAIAEMLTTELAAGAKLRTVGREVVSEVRRALALADVDHLGPGDLARLHQTLGVDYVAFGFYNFIQIGEEDPLLRVDLRLVDVRTGDVTTGGATGSEGQIFDLVNRAVGPVRQALGLGELAPVHKLAVEATMPADPVAARFYTQGLDHYRRSEFVEAKDLLERAVAADLEHPLPRAALAAAWNALGYEDRARETADAALALAEDLPHRERLEIEARVYEIATDWDSAVEVYSSLFQAFPDDVDIGCRLVDAQRSAGRTREALVTVGALRGLPSPMSGDPRIDLMEARAHFSIGDYARVEDLAQIIENKAQATGTNLHVARAKLLAGNALQAQGELGQSMSVLREAKALFDAEGNLRGSAASLEAMGLTVWYQGDLDGAGRLLERTLEIYREIGVEGRVAPVLMNLGLVAVDQGRLADAKPIFDEALDSFRSVGAMWDVAAALQNIGATCQLAGDLDEAQRRYREAMDLSTEIGAQSWVAISLTNLGEVLYLQGELEQAWQMHQEALATNREIADESGVAYDTYRMALVAFERGDDFVAEQLFEEALAAQEGMDEKLAAAETRLGLARVSLDRGDGGKAEKLARQAEQVFRTAEAADLEIFAQTVLGQSQLEQGRIEQARVALARAEELTSASGNRRARLETGIFRARVRAALDDDETSATVDGLLRLARDAEKAGFVVDAFSARLAALEIQLVGEQSSLVKSALTALADEAGARGLGRIEKRARALLLRNL